MGSPPPARGGAAKGLFRVTPRGVRAARDTQRALVALWRELPRLRDVDRFEAKQLAKGSQPNFDGASAR